MRVAFDALHIAGRSGIERYARTLICALDKEPAIEVLQLFTTRSKREEVAGLFSAQQRVRIHGVLPHPQAIGRMGEPLVRVAIAQAWKQIAQTVDLIHFPDPLHFVTGLPNAVVTVHDIIPTYSQRWAASSTAFRQRKVLDSIARDAKRIFVPSQFVHNEFIRVYGVDESRLHVVHEAASADFCVVDRDPRVLHRHGLSREERFFLCVGRLDPRKNLDAVIGAFSQLGPEMKLATRLVLVGGGSEEAVNALHRHAHENGVEDRVIILTDIADDELVQFYNAALALVFVSRSEGFGLPAVEAMKCGCPVMASGSSSLPEVAGGAALLVDETNRDAIAAGMTLLATDDARRAEYAASGLARSHDFSWERTAHATLDGYFRILNQK